MIDVLGKLSLGLRHSLLPLTGMTVSLAILVKMSDFFLLPDHCPREGLQLN